MLLAVEAINRNRSLLPRWAGAAAAVGGAAWVAKGGVIMMGGDQPPVLFEAGAPLFVIGLLGLRARLAGAGRETRMGGFLACAGGALLILTAILYALGALELSEGSFTVGSAVVLATFLAIIGSLVLLGVGTRRAHALAPGWDALPLVMGVSILPLIVVGGLLESVSETLLELPVVLFGFAWVVLGYLMWSTPAQRAPLSGS